jgi:hypothetical protein
MGVAHKQQQNHTEIPSHLSQNSYHKKMMTNASEDERKRGRSFYTLLVGVQISVVGTMEISMEVL